MSGQRPGNRATRIQSNERQAEPASAGSGGDQHGSVSPADGAGAGTRPIPAPKRRPRTSKPTRAADVPEGKVTGVVGDASATGSRSGEDVRKRGWFWHWNSIVTQYAPLIGLKGVGLLNSYTVWTDRREESPHRGYAFPSQQSEADFYGEDRAELITINKILVALDLIEIRKEMVLRVDAQGRRWKVPHNLYRVKDHGDDVSLTTKDVMRVVQLADLDRTVYRYCRRMFSPRFSPIDNDNIWHQILAELRPTDAWQRLAARTEKDETRASARSKAGHAARRGNDDNGLFSLSESGDTAASEATHSDSNESYINDSPAVELPGEEGSGQTSVAETNNGLRVDVEPSNNGSSEIGPSSVEPSNTGLATSVAPTNTTYYQSITTTTEGDSGGSEEGIRAERQLAPSRLGTEQGPDTARSADQARITFEEANSRATSPAERRQLRQLAERIATLDFPASHDPWKLIGAAIEDAVGAGSAFVAPKRIREILIRWSRDGVPVEYVDNVSLDAGGDGLSRREAGPVTAGLGIGHRSVAGGVTTDAVADAGVDAVASIVMPNGKGSVEVWSAVAHAMQASLGASAVQALFARSSIVGYDAGTVSIAVADHPQLVAFTEQHLDLVTRKLGSALRRPVRLSVSLPSSTTETEGQAEGARRSRKSPRERRAAGAAMTLGAMPVFTIERCGMTNRQIWALALDDLREGGVISRADVDAWLRNAVVLEVQVDDRAGKPYVRLGVPHVLAKRRIEGRFQTPIVQGLARMLGIGGGLELEVSLIREWLQRASSVESPDDVDSPGDLFAHG